MATKTLKTRIKLKHDSFENWSAAGNQYRLLKGEIACATIDTADPANKKLPPVMFKVGDGQHTFNELTWASALAADVYDWAKAASKPSYTYTEVGADKSGAAATAVSNAKAYTDQKIAAIPPAAEYTLEPGTTDGSLVLKKDGVAVGIAAVVKGWAELLAKAQKGIDDAAAAKAAADAKYTLPAGGIPKTDLSTDVKNALDNANSAVQSVALASGTNNGTVKLTVDGTATDNIAVTGLKSAAYTESSAYATAEQGRKADNAIPNTGTGDHQYVTGRIQYAAGYTTVLGRDPVENMEAATKQYVDTEIGKIDQFKYTISTNAATTPKGAIWYNGSTKVTGTLVASADTEYNIYLVPCKHTAAQEQEGYDEYLTVKSGSTYGWEVLGNTRDIDLSGYVPTSRKINNKALTADITLTAADVGVNETAFPGLNKVGTVTGVKMNNGSAISPDSNGVVNLGTVITDISGKQDKLNTNQLNAVNSGITSAKVTTYDGYATGKQDKLSETQLNAVNSGITSTKVSTYDGYASKISALESKPGLDKVGTVTSVSAGAGLKITGTASVTPKVEIDEAIEFIFDCGSATVNIEE